MTSKVAIDPEEPSLGRIRADSVPPPHSSASIKRCISRVERNPELANAEIFADISCETPLKEGHIPILCTDCPGLSPDKPMAIVQNVQMPIEIPDGKYLIKNRTANIFWDAGYNPVHWQNVYLHRLDFSATVPTLNVQVNIDCPESGPGPHGPGSGPDRTHGSECPGQREVDRPHF